MLVAGALAQGLQVAGAGLDGLEAVDAGPHARGLQGVAVVAGQAAGGAAGAVHVAVLAACKPAHSDAPPGCFPCERVCGCVCVGWVVQDTW